MTNQELRKISQILFAKGTNDLRIGCKFRVNHAKCTGMIFICKKINAKSIKAIEVSTSKSWKIGSLSLIEVIK